MLFFNFITMIFQFFSIKRHKKEKKKSGSYLLSRRSSIIGVRELDFRVRYGNGYYLSTMATRHFITENMKTIRMLPVATPGMQDFPAYSHKLPAGTFLKSKKESKRK